MPQTTLLILIGALGLLTGYLFARRKQTKASKGNALEQSEEKKKHEARIMELVSKRGEIRNNDVEKMLGVSDASAERYLNELDREGKIVQKGDSGRGVFYRRP